jgi:hypothetical protein
MADFEARSAEFSGHFTVHAPIDAVFELFSPLGEQEWVPGWNPELLHPSDVSWAQGQVECTAPDESTTEVSTAYTFVGLSSEGNDEIKAMTVEAYSDKMKRWKQWISDYLRRTVQTQP